MNQQNSNEVVQSNTNAEPSCEDKAEATEATETTETAEAVATAEITETAEMITVSEDTSVTEAITPEKAKSNKLRGWSFGFLCNKEDRTTNEDGIEERTIRIPNMRIEQSNASSLNIRFPLMILII